MRKALFSFLLFLGVLPVILGQNLKWASHHGSTDKEDGTYGDAVAFDSLGNVFTAGSFSKEVMFDSSSGSIYQAKGRVDIFVTKRDKSGKLLWVKQIGGTSVEQCRAIGLDSKGNVYLAGDFYGTVDFDPGPRFYLLNSTSYFVSDAFICKLDSTGNLEWARQLYSETGAAIMSLAISNDQEVFMTGWYAGTITVNSGEDSFSKRTLEGGQNSFAAKMSPSGIFSWFKSFDPEKAYNSSIGNALSLDGLGHLYCTGYFSGKVDFNPGPDTSFLQTQRAENCYITKLDTSGHFFWTKKFDSERDNRGNDIEVDKKGNVLVAGSYYMSCDLDPGPDVQLFTTGNSFNNTNYNAYVCSLDSNGRFLWAQQIGTDGNDHVRKMTTDKQGNIYLTGVFQETIDLNASEKEYFVSSNGSWDVFVSKLDPLGNFSWGGSWGGAFSDDINDIAADRNGNICLTGYFKGNIDVDPGSQMLNFAANGSSDMYLSYFENSNLVTSYKQDSFNSLSAIEIFPNPTTGEVTIKSPNAGVKQTTVMDAFGKIVQLKTIETTESTLSLPGPSGIYTIKVTAQEKQPFYIKVLKQ